MTPIHIRLLVGRQQGRRGRRIDGSEAGDLMPGVEEIANEPLSDESRRRQ